MFFPEKLSADFEFTFADEFQEFFISVDENVHLNALLFPAENSRGVIFYLHGNAGSLRTWATIAPVYLENHYDFFIVDYRGFGKSEGRITSERQLHNDIQVVYDSIKSLYNESQIVVIGYSIGTGPATHLAASNNPRMLILKAPFYNFPDLAKRYVPIFPASWVRYQFRNDQNIQRIECPVVVFHGDRDEVIYTEASWKLKEHMKMHDELIILENQTHNGINDNMMYKHTLKRILR